MALFRLLRWGEGEQVDCQNWTWRTGTISARPQDLALCGLAG